MNYTNLYYGPPLNIGAGAVMWLELQNINAIDFVTQYCKQK